MSSNDLISLSDLLKYPIRADHYDKENGNEHFIYGIETVLEYAQNLPRVDAEPMRYGKMNVHTVWHTSGWGEIFTKFECCGFEERGTKKYNYCPNCGAKMGK